MKLLLDESLLIGLVTRLQTAFLGTAQVVAAGLSGTDDWRVWCHARDHGYVLVTKDSDFVDLAARHHTA